MIKLIDKYGDEFRLLATRAVDDSHYATRKNIRAALNLIKEFGNPTDSYGDPSTRLFIRRNPKVTDFFDESMYVGVIFKHGILRLGCHQFSRATSKRIIRWA